MRCTVSLPFPALDALLDRHVRTSLILTGQSVGSRIRSAGLQGRFGANVMASAASPETPASPPPDIALGCVNYLPLPGFHCASPAVWCSLLGVSATSCNRLRTPGEGMRVGQALGLRHADFVSRDREVRIVPRPGNAAARLTASEIERSRNGAGTLAGRRSGMAVASHRGRIRDALV
jgi:hypothetical protein